MREIPKDEFPSRLLQIPDCPKKLFIEGEFPKGEYKFLCVVGSRRYTPYGKEVCEKLISSLRGLPVVIISGLAMGIDAISHESALTNGLKTIAVPGSGLSPKVLYPSSNKNLAKRILANGGCLLSEFEPEMAANIWTFPQRNRIMAGLSDATLIIEAELKSGTLITSKLATDYNRDVLTIPGSIFSKNSEGPHMLIRLGATPITNGDELKQALGFIVSEENKEQKDYSDCSDDEKKIIEIIRIPIPRDELIRKLDMDMSKFNAVLSIMEIKGLIKETMGEIHLN